MRAVVQRVASASVSVDDEVVGALGSPGLLVYLGVTHTDTAAEVDWMARKVWGLRILRRRAVRLRRLGAGARRLAVHPLRRRSQGPASHLGGRRTRLRSPSPCTTRSAPRWPLSDAHVERGVFGAQMRVASVNDGPFTVLLER